MATSSPPPFISRLTALTDPDQFLTALADTTREVLIVVTPGGTIACWNAGAEHLYGYAAEDVVEQPLTHLLPADQQDALEGWLAQVQRGQAVGPRRTTHRHRDGTPLPVSITLTPFETADGAVNGALLIARDVTPHLQALAESEDRFRAVADAAPIMIWMSDTTNACTFFNRGWLAFTGRSLAEEVGDGWTEGIHPDDIDACLETYTAHFDQRLPFRVTYRLRHHSGAYRWVLDEGGPRFSPDGTFLGYIGSVTDIDEQKRNIEHLAARSRQQAVCADLGTLALSHIGLQDFLDAVVDRVADTLDLDFCKVLEHRPDEGVLLLRAGTGWDEGHVGHTTVDTGRDSQAGYTLLTDDPVIVEDLATETRFAGPPLLTDHDVTSGMSVIIRTADDVYGILGAHTRTRRTFSPDDVNFFQTIAHLVGTAVERHRVEATLERRVAERTAELRESHARYQLLTDNVLDVIARLAPDGTFRYVSPAARRILGYTPEEVVGQTFYDFFDPDRHNIAKQLHEQLLRGEEITHTERLQHKDGRPVWVEATARGLVDPATDAIVEIHVIFRDVTERQHLIQALKVERDRLRTIVDRAPAFMAVLRGPDHVFEHANEPYYEFVGHRELIGKTVLEALPEVVGQGFIPLLDRVYETGEPFEGRNIRAMVELAPDKPPQEHFIDLVYTPLHAPDGDVTGILAHGVDVTPQVIARRRLEVLHRIDQAILSAQSSESIVENALNLLAEFIPFERGTVLLFDFEAQQATVLATHSVEGDATFAPGTTLPLDKEGNLPPFLNGETVYLNLHEAASLSPLQRLLRLKGVRTLLSAPLMVHNDCLGVLHLAAPQPLTDEHRSVATEVADSLAVALHSARLTEEVEEARARLEAVSQRLVQVQEDERRHLALELHDQIGQMLTTVGRSLDQLTNEPLSPDAAAALQQAQRNLDLLTQQVRSLSLDLRPSLLDDLGLLPALSWYFHKYTRDTGIAVDFQHTGLRDQRLPDIIEVTAYRIIQETLTNVARYAQIDEVTVQVLLRDAHLYLRVEDEGAGFDADASSLYRETGGLTGIRERARLLGGDVSVESVPGEGTTIIALLPTSPAPQDA